MIIAYHRRFVNIFFEKILNIFKRQTVVLAALSHDRAAERRVIPSPRAALLPAGEGFWVVEDVDPYKGLFPPAVAGAVVPLVRRLFF